MTNLTASGLPRAIRCVASLVHPQADFQTKWADLGREKHKGDEDAITVGDLSTLPGAVADAIAGMDVFAEVAFALNAATRTAKILGYGISRDYGVMEPYETPGTCDLLAISKDRTRVVIGDRKGYEEVDHPSENRQTLFYAAAAALVFGVSEVDVWIYGTIGEPRVATLDFVELDQFTDELAALHVRAMAAKANPRAYEVPGDHCTYCKGFEACSKFNALVVTIENGSLEKRLDALLSLDDDETAGKFYVVAGLLRQLSKRMDARVYGRAAQRPIPIPGTNEVFGKRLKPGNRKLDADTTIQAIREILGIDKAPAFEQIAIGRDTSQAAIERAAKKFAGKGQIERLKNQIVARVDALGGVTRGTTESFESGPRELFQLSATK